MKNSRNLLTFNECHVRENAQKRSTMHDSCYQRLREAVLTASTDIMDMADRDEEKRFEFFLTDTSAPRDVQTELLCGQVRTNKNDCSAHLHSIAPGAQT